MGLFEIRPPPRVYTEYLNHNWTWFLLSSAVALKGSLISHYACSLKSLPPFFLAENIVKMRQNKLKIQNFALIKINFICMYMIGHE